MPSHALYTKIEYTELITAFILLGIVAAFALVGAIFCSSLMPWELVYIPYFHRKDRTMKYEPLITRCLKLESAVISFAIQSQEKKPQSIQRRQMLKLHSSGRITSKRGVSESEMVTPYYKNSSPSLHILIRTGMFLPFSSKVIDTLLIVTLSP